MTADLGPVYVYALARAGALDPEDLNEPGLAGEAVELAGHGDVVALVSPLGDHRPRSSRADVSAHHRVVEAAAEHATVVPLQFGVVEPSAEAVADELLAPRAEEFAALLDRLDGCAELRLKAVYHDGVDLREVVEGNARIRRLREQVLRGGAAGGVGQRIRLGEMVLADLQQRHEAQAVAILGRLEDHAVAVRRLSTGDEHGAVHAAFLVERGSAERFDEEVETLAAELADRLSLELIGPLAPWDFAQMDTEVGV